MPGSWWAHHELGRGGKSSWESSACYPRRIKSEGTEARNRKGEILIEKPLHRAEALLINKGFFLERAVVMTVRHTRHHIPLNSSPTAGEIDQKPVFVFLDHFLSDHDRSADCYWLRLDVFIATGIMWFTSLGLASRGPLMGIKKSSCLLGRPRGPADHSAGILHSRLRLTAARGWSCRYVSLSGSLAPRSTFISASPTRDLKFPAPTF
ncbi:hypothetical protein TSUD_252750 [Trifolium subterraneum]|nr:hypothetical protein TSUD_252750 [Trifolium subterraneum]